MKRNPLGLNNFAQLEAAGLVAGADDFDSMKAKTEARVQELGTLVTKVTKVQAYLADLSLLERPRQLKRLTEASIKLKELHATSLPVGAKRHIEACLNEVVSLKEGVYATNTRLDQQTLALTACAAAKTELTAMIESASHRLEKITADSSDDLDEEEFFKKIGDIITKNSTESTKLAPIANKPFVLARVPVVLPVDGPISAEKLPQLGFKSESLSGYPIIHNQLALGINPKYLSSHDPAISSKLEELNRKMKAAGIDMEQIKKVQNSMRSGQKQIEALEKEGEEDEKKKAKNAPEIARLQDLVKKAQTRIDNFKVLVGDPKEIADMADKLKKSHAAQPAEIRAEAERIIKQLERMKKVKLRLVADKPFSYKSGVWFWLMPDKELDMLARASRTKRVSVTRWGFAFN